MSVRETMGDVNRTRLPYQEISDQTLLVIEPLVSVFVITYNHEAYIEEAIAGIAGQETDFPFEIVIGEDCSTDRTREILLRCQKDYPEIIRLVISPENVGIMENYFRTHEACRGEYIAYCEGDDFWTDNQKLQKQVNAIQGQPGAEGCFHDIYRMHPDGMKVRLIGDRIIETRVDTYSLIKDNNIATVSMLYRKACVDRHLYSGWFLDGMHKGDYSVALMLAKEGNWIYLDELMGVYRIHDGGVWSMKGNRHKAEKGILFFKLLKKHYEDQRIHRIINEKLRVQYFNLSLNYLRERMPFSAIGALLRMLSVPGRSRELDINWAKYGKTIIRMFLPSKRSSI